MLEEVRIQNFKSLKDCRVKLGDFQVLVGVNGSGKSSFLQALDVLGKVVAYQERFDSYFESSFKYRGAPTKASIRWELNFSDSFEYKLNSVGDLITEEALLGGNCFYSLTPTEDKSRATYGARENLEFSRGASGLMILAQEPLEHALAGRIIGMRRYHLDPVRLAMECQVAHQERPVMEADGKGLATVLDYLLTTERRAFNRIETSLQKFIPRFHELLLKPGSSQGTRTLGIRDIDGWEIDADQLSGGFLLFLGYLVLVHGHKTSVLMLEEPENGIHPQRLKEVVDLTRAMARSENVQVIMASHSPYLLDFVEKDEVLVVHRETETGETHITPLLDLPGAAKRAADYFTGELVFNFSERDLLT